MKTPKGKLNLVINFAKVVALMLQETSKSGEPDGADMFFPAQIFVLFQISQYKQLKSNLVYIRCFRVELQGQEEYYLTAMESALEFMLNLTDKDLKMEEGEASLFHEIMDGTTPLGQ